MKYYLRVYGFDLYVEVEEKVFYSAIYQLKFSNKKLIYKLDKKGDDIIEKVIAGHCLVGYKIRV